MFSPCRTALYLPASKPRALEKAKGLLVDALIFDLEDAVAPAEKTRARGALLAALAQNPYGPRQIIVRINGLETEWGAEDLAALAQAQALGTRIDAVLLSKVTAPADVAAAAAHAPEMALWTMIETAAAVLQIEAILAHPSVRGAVMGTNDLLKELRGRDRPDRLALLPALGMALLAARAHGVILLDGVYTAFLDEAGLAAECAQGRDMGFDGKTIIHPAQIAITNRAFGPDAAALELARRQIAAHAAILAKGEGVAVVDGRIVENLHIVTAEALIAQAAAIAALEAATLSAQET